MLFKMHNPGACDEVCGSAVCLRSQSNSAWQLENISHLALSPFLSAPSGKTSRPTGEAAAPTAVGGRRDGGCEVTAAWTWLRLRPTCLRSTG